MNKMKNIILNSQKIIEGNLIVINKGHPIKIDEKELIIHLCPSLVTHRDILLEEHCAFQFRQLLHACGGEGEIIPISGYRTKAEQEQIYSSSMADNGIEFTTKFVAYPDESEHQTGLAIDVAEKKGSIDFICPSFPYDGVCQEFRKLAPIYGFIQRYPRGKEHITGIAHEPWHFRYVGYPHSEIIGQNDFTLEEYIDYLKNFPFINEHLLVNHNGNIVEIYYCESKNTEITVTLSHDVPYEISGNNMDGFIITIWRMKN